MTAVRCGNLRGQGSPGRRQLRIPGLDDRVQPGVGGAQPGVGGAQRGQRRRVFFPGRLGWQTGHKPP